MWYVLQFRVLLPDITCRQGLTCQIQVAQIIPLGIGSFSSKVQDLNKAIPTWAAQQNTTDSPIWVVDQFTGYSGSSDNRDGIHPNDGGDTKMANIWFPAVVKALEAAKADKAKGF